MNYFMMSRRSRRIDRTTIGGAVKTTGFRLRKVERTTRGVAGKTMGFMLRIGQQEVLQEMMKVHVEEAHQQDSEDNESSRRTRGWSHYDWASQDFEEGLSALMQ